MVASLNTFARRLPTWVVYGLGVLPAVWLVYLALTGGLGVEPIEALEHRLGLIGLQFLIAGLCVTPLRRWAGLNLIRFRRAIGLLAFFYILLHLLVWLFLDVQIWSQIWADILKRPYITIGMVGFALMVPLALTSNNWAVRSMGAAGWRRLHQLTYAVGILGAAHFVMLSKGFQLEPFLYLSAILALLALRIRWNRARATA